MSETTVPTMNFRWLVPHMAAYASQPSCARLQQAHYVGGQLVWRNVPIVALQAAPVVEENIPEGVGDA